MNKLATSLEHFDTPIKVKNVCITKSNRQQYLYVIIREHENDYYFYDFANSLTMATRACREIENGLVITMDNAL